MKKFLLCLFFVSFFTQASAFQVYAFIPWHDVVENGQRITPPSFSDTLKSYGIKKVDVVYEKRYFTDSRSDLEKIKAAAEGSHQYSQVSFDTEFGNRFKPDTVIPDILKIVEMYRQSGGVAKVGVYATAPQNTFAWSPNIKRFDRINSQYAAVAQAVDILSPVLYNYAKHDTVAWKRAATYNIHAAKKYGTGKPIIPYTAVTVKLKKIDNGHMVDLLSEDEMRDRLEELDKLGASGCIIWASSQDRLQDGYMPYFDPASGWGKALVDFIKKHPNKD